MVHFSSEKPVQYSYSTHLKHIMEDYSAETIKGSNSSGQKFLVPNKIFRFKSFFGEIFQKNWDFTENGELQWDFTFFENEFFHKRFHLRTCDLTVLNNPNRIYSKNAHFEISKWFRSNTVLHRT